VLYREIYPLR